MNSKLLHEHEGLRTFALVFEKDEELKGALLGFAVQNRLGGSQLTAIGAFSEVTLAYFDRNTKSYHPIPVREQVELVSLTGTITRKDAKPALHAHAVVGKRDGSALAGHLLDGRVWPTLEMILSEAPKHLFRISDPETGLALIDVAA